MIDLAGLGPLDGVPADVLAAPVLNPLLEAGPSVWGALDAALADVEGTIAVGETEPVRMWIRGVARVSRRGVTKSENAHSSRSRGGPRLMPRFFDDVSLEYKEAGAAPKALFAYLTTPT